MGTSGSGVRIKVSTEVLSQKAAEVSTAVDGMKQDFESIKQTVRASKAYWLGEAGELHRRLFEEQSDQIDTILKRLEEHPADLETISGIYAGKEKEIQAVPSGLPADVIS